MNLKTNLDALQQTYRIYDRFVDSLDIACQKGCAACCSGNVTLTSLEGVWIIDYLRERQMAEVFERPRGARTAQRFQPNTTTNRLAELCAQEEDLPEEEASPLTGTCPLLTENTCPIYPVRPFNCRCLVSRHPCDLKGYAMIDDFVLAVNTLFLQVIEHLDRQGVSGNLVDVLHLLKSEKEETIYRKSKILTPKDGLVKNRPISVLMIPPEHREKMRPVLRALQNIQRH